ITLNSLPDGTVGFAYPSVTASGGIAPYTFALTGGSAPTGLTLNSDGSWSGTPTTANTFNFTVTATDSYGCTGSQAYTVVINTPPSFTIDDVTHPEGNSSTTDFTFTVTKTGSTTVHTSVDVATLNGTATTGDNDYQLNTGTLSFLPNETTKQITVLVNGDTTYEANETFTVHLSNAQNSTIADADGTGTIQNDDAPSATLVVNTTADTDDGLCTSDPGGCHLSEEINAGDANGIRIENFGGGILNNGTQLDISACVITGNVSGEGGGLDAQSGTVTVTNSTVSSNSASGVSGEGGGIFTNSGVTLNITGSTISGN